MNLSYGPGFTVRLPNALDCSWLIFHRVTTRVAILGGVAILASSLAMHGQDADPLQHWQIVGSPGGSIRGLAYQGGTFVAAGYTTNITVSTNGTDWGRASSSGLTNYFDGLLAVTEGAGQFVAVGGAGVILSSPDGFQWTQRRRGSPYEELWAVTYGGGAFVAVGYENPGGAIVATSVDGKLWEKRSLPIVTTPRNVVYGNGLYVAVGAPVSMVSTNGRDWTQLSGVLAQGVAYGNGRFVATTSTWNPGGYLSTNGLDWTPISLPAFPSGSGGMGYYGNYYTAAYANGLFIIGGWCDECTFTERTGLLATSPDGLQWTLRPFGSRFLTGPIRDIVFVDGSFYLGDQGGKIWKSDPLPPASPLVVTRTSLTGARLSLSVQAVAGYHYVVESAGHPDAPTWQRTGASLFATGDQLLIDDLEATSPTRFYRIRTE